MIPDRYKKNMDMLSPEENASLAGQRVCVAGCGGLGGYVLEMLARMGIGNLTAVDGDLFDESNLNRQIFSHTGNIGLSKAIVAREQIELINPLVSVNAINDYLSKQNAARILKGHDVVVDALDSIPSRLLLEAEAESLNIPLVHGSIAGWYGQVTTVLPGDRTITYLYPEPNREGEEKLLGNPSFTPGLVASIQVSEVVKILIGRGNLLHKRILIIDTLTQEYEYIEL
jgi:molybdopterin/thiamine biosynthesis adenylyltransferase